MNKPHASWAHAYDQIYEKSFGSFYSNLTNVTLTQIQKVASAPCELVDFGAGTGRLSIPLAKLGYKVTAVEPCEEMLLQLKSKLGSETVSCHIQRMEDFELSEKFDVATCVFTVLIYLLDEESLRRSIFAASRSLKEGGFLLIDIPSQSAFTNLQISVNGCRRSIEVQPIDSDIYQFSENTEIDINGDTFHVQDSFPIRFWSIEFVMSILESSGFKLMEDISENFRGTGASYFILRKISS